MKLTVYDPQYDRRTEYVNVESADTEWGDVNAVHIEYADGSTDRHAGVGVTIETVGVDQ